ncbi:hypothetical protein AK812_SmicGene11550 [Symbiodinium microadriaticum]|uniref:Uncharacterized protein n=1 Tax=Symbiodinium microadriaticum TaxID=2951 RepID=A0A1Q9ED19_SYMMI|nr:hypothetical protein AK812_SmicGene11550 [Symbiodinium microadriaticum]
MASVMSMFGAAEKKVEEAAKEAGEAMSTVATAVEEQVSTAAHTVEERVKAAEVALASASAQLVDMMRAYLHGKITVVVKAVTGALPYAVKMVLDDPEMPGPARRVKDRAVDIAWPEVQEQIALEMEHGFTDMRDALKELAGQKIPEDDKPAYCCLIAFLRYHLYPYDRGLWGVSTDPIWVLTVLLTVIPMFSVAGYIFPFIFLLIDKTDEFQLLFFIVQVKGIQFLSQGILGVYVSFFEFIACSLADEVACRDKEVAGQWAQFFDMLSYVLIFLMVWTAYAMVYLLSRRRAPKHVGDEIPPATFRGGNMLYLISFDLLLTLIGGTILVIVMSSADWDFTAAQVGYAIEAIKVVHGFLMLPFFVMLVVPILRNVVLHTRPTGYDRKGNCRNYTGPAGQTPKAAQVIPRMELFGNDEAEELMANLKKLLMGGSVSSLVSSFEQRLEGKRE